MKKYILLSLIVLLSFTLTGCGDDEEKGNTVYVTVYPVQYLVEAIAGDTVKVERVPGSQVHSESIAWQPQEIIDMKDSDLIFYVNAGLDPYIPDSEFSTFRGASTSLVDLSSSVEYGKICASESHTHFEDDHSEGEEPLVCNENSLQDDPHFWLDPVRFLVVAEFVKNELIKEYEGNSALYEANFLLLQADLVKLNEDFELMATQVTKPLLATSLLFTYISNRYLIEIISMSTTPHSGDNIPGDLIEYTQEVVAHDIRYIIYEKNSYSYAGDTLFDELNGDNYEIEKGYIHGLGNLTTEEIDTGQDYLKIMYDNLTMLHISTK